MWKGKSHYHNIAVKISIERALSRGRSDSLVSKASRVLPPKQPNKLRMYGKNLGDTHRNSLNSIQHLEENILQVHFIGKNVFWDCMICFSLPS